jgi:hypothetical protein
MIKKTNWQLHFLNLITFYYIEDIIPANEIYIAKNITLLRECKI